METLLKKLFNIIIILSTILPISILAATSSPSTSSLGEATNVATKATFDKSQLEGKTMKEKLEMAWEEFRINATNFWNETLKFLNLQKEISQIEFEKEKEEMKTDWEKIYNENKIVRVLREFLAKPNMEAK